MIVTNCIFFVKLCNYINPFGSWTDRQTEWTKLFNSFCLLPETESLKSFVSLPRAPYQLTTTKLHVENNNEDKIDPTTYLSNKIKESHHQNVILLKSSAVCLGTGLRLWTRLQVRTANGPRWDMGEFTSPPIRTLVTGSNFDARLKMELAAARLRSWSLLELWRPDLEPVLLTTDTCTLSKRQTGHQ